MPVVDDTGHQGLLLPGRADDRRPEVLLSGLFDQGLQGLHAHLAPQLGGIPDLRLSIFYIDVYRLIRRPEDEDRVETGLLEFRPEVAP